MKKTPSLPHHALFSHHPTVEQYRRAIFTQESVQFQWPHVTKFQPVNLSVQIRSLILFYIALSL